MIPNLASVVKVWAVPVLLKTVIKETVDFEPVNTVTVESIKAVVQPSTDEQLEKATIDWSKKHFTFHSVSKIELNQVIEYKGKDYIIVTDGEWDLYGFSKVVGEETKQPLLAAS